MLVTIVAFATILTLASATLFVMGMIKNNGYSNVGLDFTAITFVVGVGIASISANLYAIGEERTRTIGGGYGLLAIAYMVILAYQLERFWRYSRYFRQLASSIADGTT